VQFSPNPVDSIIRGATPVPVSVTVTPSGVSGVSFQADNGNVSVQGAAPNVSVAGVAVGSSTVKANIGQLEVGGFGASVIENTNFPPINGTVAGGATPSQTLTGWGITWEEFVTADVTASDFLQ
jgi:hypothetical protein